MADHRKTVSEIYAAFQRGDIKLILDRCADGVRWEHWAENWAQNADVPWMKKRTGKAEVQKFFDIVGRFQFREFNVISLMAGENQAAVEVVVEATDPVTGASFRDEELHLWNFDAAGRVERFRHYLDTAKHVAAVRSGNR